MQLDCWPEDGSLEPKHVANYVLMNYIYMCCLTEYVTYHVSRLVAYRPSIVTFLHLENLFTETVKKNTQIN
jgi:hypothetical protein